MTKLEIKTIAINELNKYCDIVYKTESDYFKNLIGQCVQKTDNSLLKKHKRELLSIKEKKEGYYLTVQSYYDCSYYSLDIKVRVCFHGGSYEDNTYFCIYEEQNVNIDTIVNDKLQGKSFYVSQPIYNVSELLEQQKEATKYLSLYKEALSKIPYQFHGLLNLKSLY